MIIVIKKLHLEINFVILLFCLFPNEKSNKINAKECFYVLLLKSRDFMPELISLM